MSNKHIKITNIEKYIYHFDNNNDEFKDIKWLEPIFITMASAYDDDVEHELTTDNDYLYNMITMNYNKKKTYTPIEKIHT